MENQNANSDIISGPKIVGKIVVNKGGSGDPVPVRVVMSDVDDPRESYITFTNWRPQSPNYHNPGERNPHCTPNAVSCGTSFMGRINFDGAIGTGTPSGFAYLVDIHFRPIANGPRFYDVEVYVEPNFTDRPACPE